MKLKAIVKDYKKKLGFLVLDRQKKLLLAKLLKNQSQIVILLRIRKLGLCLSFLLNSVHRSRSMYTVGSYNVRTH